MAESKVHISRFTPSRMMPETLEAIFVQRQQIAADSLERIRESALHGNMHYLLFIGPRGCGKTHFVSLIFHRLKALTDVRDSLRIAWLNEDKTSTSVLDLNRRIYEALSVDHPDEFPKELLGALYDRKPSEAAAYLQSLLKERLGDKTALVVVENLDALFENLGRQGQHDWRAHLQESGQIAILATAQQLFPGVSDRDFPFYGFFQSTFLKPLSVQEGLELLKSIATQQEDEELAQFLNTPKGRSRVRTLHHLSGGNHRVYVIFSEFINRKSLDELVAPFEKTLDELIPYYQERLRWLTPQQRMIVEHLCECDRAVPVREIARSLFATSQTISKQLKELKQKRYVRSARRGRESLYELTEPLMRLAMELKESRGGPVRLIVDFLRVWYSREELENRLKSLSSRETPERRHVESAIEQFEIGAESLNVRALLTDIEELARGGPERGIVEAVQEIEAAAGKENQDEVARQVLAKLEGRYPSLPVGARLSPEGIPFELVLLARKPAWIYSVSSFLSYVERLSLGLDRGAETTSPDQADLKTLALVGGYQFGTIMQTLPNVGPKIPSNLKTRFDHKEFLTCLRGSISLSIDEKHRLTASLPRLSQFRIDELLRLFSEEKRKFSELPTKHLPGLRTRERRFAREWCKTPWDGSVSEEAQSWLDDHREDELKDLLYAVDNPSGYEFSNEEQCGFRLRIAAWFFAEDRQEDFLEQVERVQIFVRGISDTTVRVKLLRDLGARLRQWKLFDRGLEILAEAAELAPEDAEVCSQLGYLYSAAKRNEEALEAHSVAISLAPEDPRRYGDRIGVLLDLEQYRQALEESESLIALDSSYPGGWRMKSISLRGLRQVSRAVDAIDEAIRLRETDAWLWFSRGLTLSKARRFPEAVESYSRAIQLNATECDFFNSRAVSLYRLGHFEKARESVAQALRLDPQNVYAIYTEVEILLASGRWNEGWARAQQNLRKFPPKEFPVKAEQEFVQIVFTSSHRFEEWQPRLEALCDTYSAVEALSYLGDGLVRSLGDFHGEAIGEETLLGWERSWNEVGGQYLELSFALRLFSAGIKYLRTLEPNSLLDLPVEQRAILEQIFGIEVRHEE